MKTKNSVTPSQPAANEPLDSPALVVGGSEREIAKQAVEDSLGMTERVVRLRVAWRFEVIRTEPTQNTGEADQHKGQVVILPTGVFFFFVTTKALLKLFDI